MPSNTPADQKATPTSANKHGTNRTDQSRLPLDTTVLELRILSELVGETQYAHGIKRVLEADRGHEIDAETFYDAVSRLTRRELIAPLDTSDEWDAKAAVTSDGIEATSYELTVAADAAGHRLANAEPVRQPTGGDD